MNNLNVCTIKASNMEVLYLFRNIIEDWIAETISGGNVPPLLEALLTGDVDTLHELLYRAIFEITSYNDVGINNSENFYHALLSKENRLYKNNLDEKKRLAYEAREAALLDERSRIFDAREEVALTIATNLLDILDN